MGPVLSVSGICRHIYGEYYHSFINKKGKNGFKTLRFSDRINKNDITTKFNNLKQMHEAGERRFRLEATND